MEIMRGRGQGRGQGGREREREREGLKEVKVIKVGQGKSPREYAKIRS